MCEYCEKLLESNEVKLSGGSFVRDRSKRFEFSMDLVRNNLYLSKSYGAFDDKEGYILLSVCKTKKEGLLAFSCCKINYCPLCGRRLGEE